MFEIMADFYRFVKQPDKHASIKPMPTPWPALPPRAFDEFDEGLISISRLTATEVR
jgi:hypothetical protein